MKPAKLKIVLSVISLQDSMQVLGCISTCVFILFYRNKIEELLDYLKEKPEDVTKYLTTRAISLMNEKRPELVPDCKC